MGMIYKRGRIYWIKYYRNGKPYRESARSTKEADAKRLLRKREGEISEGKLPGIYFDKVHFKELAEDFLTDYRINKRKSIDCVERSIRLHLSPFFEGMKAPQVTTSKIRAYIAQRMEEGASNASINRELAALKRMYNIANQCTPPKVARAPFIPMLSENNVRKGFFEHDEFKALRDALPDYLRPVFVFAYKTGWRRSEITGLTWDRIDLKQGIVRLEVGETKNDEGRTVYLDEELEDVIRNQFVNRHLGCPFVFHRGGEKIGDIRKAWATACRKGGLKHKLFHDLRRTAVRNMVRAGIPERVAMTISGHKTRSVFDRYNIVNSDDLKQAASKLKSYLEAQSSP